MEFDSILVNICYNDLAESTKHLNNEEYNEVVLHKGRMIYSLNHKYEK